MKEGVFGSEFIYFLFPSFIPGHNNNYDKNNGNENK
jgi:hypothetical protein